MRLFLDRLYGATLWLAAFCLAAIASMVGAQLAARILDGALALAHLPRTEFVILSLNEICGFLLAAASFLALAGTLKSGVHIRVTMVLGALREDMRRYAEMAAFAATAVAVAYMTWNLANFAWVSFQFNEVSIGVVRVPLCFPQAAMAFGSAILTVALVDEFLVVARGGRPSFRHAEDAITLGKEG
jgi:TRAP-type C4-dicarboxylate transport system permease small subunit